MVSNNCGGISLLTKEVLACQIDSAASNLIILSVAFLALYYNRLCVTQLPFVCYILREVHLNNTGKKYVICKKVSYSVY